MVLLEGDFGERRAHVAGAEDQQRAHALGMT
jgi:hypothetical protein